MLADFHFGREIWIFPFAHAFGAWFLFLVLYLWAGKRPVFRSVVSLLGAAFFLSRGGFTGFGALALLIPFVLWKLARSPGKVFGLITLVIALALAFGHVSEIPGFGRELIEGGRLSAHAFILFFFFRVISYSVAVGFRGETPSLTETIEYFFAPPFLVEPGKGFVLTFATFSEPAEGVSRSEGLRWVLQGIIFHLAFAVVGAWLIAFLNAQYTLEVYPWRIEWFLAVGVAAFFLAYLEKARMSYILAGLLTLSGRRVVPDFNAPWAARNLLDYWRRFHYWVLEFYVECLYQPLSYYLSRFVSPRLAVALGIFLTFLFGTTLSHWIFYPASFGVTLFLSFLFAVVTTLHYFFVAWRPRFLRGWEWTGMPLTWASVSFLYAFAYPAFGLGWSWGELWRFF